MKSKILILLAVFMATNAFALKVTNYTTSGYGMLHNVTVAFDDLGKSAKVRCVIEMNGDPVGMMEDMVKGVGTMVILIDGGTPDDTEAECYELEAEGYGEMAD